MSRLLRRGAATVVVSLVAATTAAILLGGVSVVTTSGTSMNPAYRQGDLVIVAAADSYAVGQIVAYRDHVHDLVVLHRIVGGDPTGYELKGDHNPSVDAVRPPEADLMGRAVLHVPRAGDWLHRLVGPVPLAVVAVALLTAGGATGVRRRRRRHPMSRRAGRRATSGTPLDALSPHLRAAAGATVAVGVLGLALGVPTWATPVRTLAHSVRQATRSMTFSYDAVVPRTPAYDGTTVRAPDPVFRRLADAVEVRLVYRGGPGSVTVTAELSTANGWRSTVPLAARTPFSTSRYAGTVRLDLSALEHRAHAAAAVTGLPADQVAVAVVAHVTDADGAGFAPSLRLTLTPLRLALADDPKALTVQDAATVRQTRSVPRTLGLLGRELAVATGRTITAVLLLVAVLAALGLVLVARRTAPMDESAAIRRRYAPLLLPVHPMPTPAGHPVVDVATFAALAKLAERYGLLILHWSRGGVDTFVLQDDGTSYRYRVGASSPAAPTRILSGAPPPRALPTP